MKVFTPLRGKHAEKPTRQVERHLNVRLLPVLIAVFGILYLSSNYRGWLVFTLGTGGAWLLALLWIRSMERNLWIERKINLAWATVGESVPEQIKLVNNGWLPAIWVEISDDSSTLEKPLRMVSDIGQRAWRNRHISHLFKQRGLYSLGPTRLRSSDPLGIYTLTLHDQHASTILVTPPVIPLPQLKIVTGGWAGDERRSRGSVARNISDAGVRNYVPGDSLRRIHWRASAHFDTLIVRQLEASSSRDWWIYIDLEASVQAGSGKQSTLELCIVLAASLAMIGLKEHRRVGLLLAGPDLVWIEPGADATQSWRILRALSIAEAGNRSFHDLLKLSRPAQPATSILITPSTDSSWVAMATHKRGSGGMMAILVDPVDFGSPVDQRNVVSALAHNRIRYARIPGELLGEAYSAAGQNSRRQIGAIETRRYTPQQGRSNWQKLG